MKPDRWPVLDRLAWERGCAPRDPFPADPFEDAGRGAELSLASRESVQKGYGRWLSFLDEHGWLDPDQPPLERVTRPRLQLYLRELRARGNRSSTIIGCFSVLRMALRIMAPGVYVGWVVRPYGRTVYSMLCKTRRFKQVPDSGVLTDWAIGIMDRARAAPLTPAVGFDFRDGLLLAMLARRARRLRSMTLLRPERELVLRGGCYRLELTPGQVKTKKRDEVDLPEQLTPYIRHYLDVVRPLLLGDQVHDAFWVNPKGTAWTAKGIAHRVQKLTRQRFGEGFGPHAFRHAIATTAALRAPDRPWLAAGVLGISSAIVQQHYNLAGQVQATRDYAAVLEERLRRLEGADAD